MPTEEKLLPDSELGPEKRDVQFVFKATRSQFVEVGDIPKTGDIKRGPNAMDYEVLSVNRRRNLEAPGREVVVVTLEPKA